MKKMTNVQIPAKKHATRNQLKNSIVPSGTISALILRLIVLNNDLQNTVCVFMYLKMKAKIKVKVPYPNCGAGGVFISLSVTVEPVG